MYEIANLNITNSRIRYVTEEVRKIKEEINKFKSAFDKYGDMKLGKSYYAAYSEWGGPDPRMASGIKPDISDYTSNGSYIDIDSLVICTSDKFEDRGSLLGHLRFLRDRVASYEQRLKELQSDRSKHMKSVEETGFDLDGFDPEGYDKDGFNPDGYDRDGYNKNGRDEYGYDRDGYDENGLNTRGFNREGIHFQTKTEYDLEGFNQHGVTRDGFSYYNGILVDKEGYDKKGFQIVDTENHGFNREGYDKEGYDKEGKDKDGKTKQDKQIEWVRGRKKIATPYFKVAKRALISFYGYTPEQAEKEVLDSSLEELETKVGAKQTMMYALEGLRNALSKRGIEMSDEDFANCIESTFEIQDSAWRGSLGDMRYEISENKDKNALVVEALSYIHDGWVKDNEKKFTARDRKFQHLPIELIGWEEAKKDLLFLEPILGPYSVSEQGLVKAYYKKVDEFLVSKNIRSQEDLQQAISQGSEFYPALEGQETIIEALSDPEIVSSGIMQKLDSRITKRIEKVAKRDKGTITLEKVEKMTSGVRTQNFAKATTTLRENAQEQTKENDAVSLDDE